MWTGLFCIVSALVLVGVAFLTLKVLFSPVRAVVVPCALSEVPGLTQMAVESLGFPVFEPFGVRGALRSFEELGFEPSGAVVIKNPPLPEMYVALQHTPDGAVQRYVDEWADDLAAMKRKSVLARAIGWFR